MTAVIAKSARINVVVRAAHTCARTAIGNPNKGGDRIKRARPALPFLIPWRVFLGAWVKNPYPRVCGVFELISVSLRCLCGVFVLISVYVCGVVAVCLPCIRTDLRMFAAYLPCSRGTDRRPSGYRAFPCRVEHIT